MIKNHDDVIHQDESHSKWVLVVGAIFGGMTLIFLMILVLLSLSGNPLDDMIGI